MKNLTLLFDQDGTLANSGPGIKRCAKMVLDKYGIIKQDSDLNVFVGPPLKDSFLNFGIKEEDLDDAVALYRKEYNSKGVYENKIYDGIEDILKTLKNDKFPIYIVTSKPKDMAKEVVNYFNISQYFINIYGTDPNSKRVQPKSELVKECIDDIKNNNSKFVMIGDTKFDINAAKANNILSIGCLWGYGSEESIRNSQPDYIVNKPSDILYLTQLIESDC